MQTLSQIKALFAVHELRPRKRFGQNFLHDANKVRAILDAAEIRPGETVLEVGPGTGVLTEELLEGGARVVAVDIDRDLCAILRERLGPDTERFTLLNADVLADKHTINVDVHCAIDGMPFTLVANLPYNVASPLLATLATDHPAMKKAIVMVQEEVGARLTASSGGKEYGPLGIIVQAMCEVEDVTRLSPNCFWPAPKVDSVVLKLTRRVSPLTDDPAALARLLQKLFTKRRKQVGSILGRDTPMPAGINPTFRPEQLTIEQLVALSRTVQL